MPIAAIETTTYLGHLCACEPILSSTAIMAEAGSSQPAEDWKDEESSDWLTAEDRHVFILSAAGKPIFSLHGDEQKLSSFIGLVQAIVSFCEDAGDQVRTVKAGPYSFVFLLRNNIYLLSASRTHHEVAHMLLELWGKLWVL